MERLKEMKMKILNTKILKQLLLILLMVLLLLGVSQSSYAKWIEDEDGVHYKDKNGDYVTGFQIIDDATYYFDGEGNLLKGKFYVESQDAYYYSNEDGEIMIGVIDEDGCFYLTDETGKLRTGFVEYENERYYFNSNVQLLTGWFKYGEDWYYADNSGKLKSGFLELDGYRYYLDGNGVRVSDTIMEIDGVTYIFNSDGTIDENATMLYPLLCVINEKRQEYNYSPLSINKKVQACAIKRAEMLSDSFLLQEEKTSIETMLGNRGVSCSGGFEFSYGGINGYGMEQLLADILRDERFMLALEKDAISDVGLGYYMQDNILYFDIIFVMQ